MKNFVKNDEGFVCAHCGKTVPPLGYSSRNHCPFCLWSIHIDENPGDRACDCKGEMAPVSAIPDAKKEFIIVHKCTKCNAIRRCKIANDDNRSLIISLTAKGF